MALTIGANVILFTFPMEGNEVLIENLFTALFDNVTAGQVGAGKACVTDTTGALLFNGGGGVGYGAGAGGAVTQVTSRTTGVTLNKITGQITLFAAAGVATNTSFTVTNSLVAANDTVLVSVKSGTNTYLAFVTAVAAGSFQITFQSVVGTASDSPVFTYAVIKAAAS